MVSPSDCDPCTSHLHLSRSQSVTTRSRASSKLTTVNDAPSGAAYQRVLFLLSNDPNYRREVALGKRIGFYRLGEELGSGNFSKVRLGSQVLTKERVAIKAIEKAKLDQKAQRLLEREIQNMEATHHPNIIRIFEVVETLTRLHLIMEYAGGGELYNYVVSNTKLSELDAKPIFAQILAAVIHMHRIGIIHRDIKAENVFFAGPNWVKLGDLGFSVAVNAGDTLNTFCGSPPYAAPELFKDKRYRGEYVDIWALGILLYFLVTGTTPFHGDTVSEMKRQILNGYFHTPDDLSTSCKDLINGILKMDPPDRYTLVDMHEHTWLSPVTSFPQPYQQFGLYPDEEELAMKPILAEIWNTMHGYGISTVAMKDAAQRAAKNPIIGTYRILLHRMQTKLHPDYPAAIRTPSEPRKSIINKPVTEQTYTTQKKSLTQRTSTLCSIL